MELKSLCKFIVLVSLLFSCCNIPVSVSVSASTSVNTMTDNVATEQAIRVNVIETSVDKTVRVVSKCVICFLTIGLGLYSVSLLKGKKEKEEEPQQHQQGKEVSQENNEDIKDIEEEEENQKEN